VPDPNPVSPEDFGAFYTHYRSYVYSTLISANYPGERDDLEDGVQNTFLKFWKYRDTYQPTESNGWLPILGTIATRLACDENRSKREKTRWRYGLSPENHDRPDEDVRIDPERVLLSKERATLLNRLLEQLTPMQRVAVLSYNAGTQGEWPARMKQALKNRTHRARYAMRKAIANDPGTYGPLLEGRDRSGRDSARRERDLARWRKHAAAKAARKKIEQAPATDRP
jgi:RNA polymerase sigma factor (sigma-70 family)